jgi:ATP-dependent helicase/nuclease subunit B
MHEEVFRAVANGATLITASRRLARTLTDEFHSIQTVRGNRTWKRPDILPFEAFLDHSWREWLWRGVNGDVPLLLNGVQEQAIWDRIIRQSPAGASLLQISETARQAVKTWQLVIGYRLSIDGSFEATEDSAAFAAWSREFRNACRSNGWLERARLCDFLRDKIGSAEVPAPAEVYVAGFDEMTPQQSQFLAALGDWRAVEPSAFTPTVERWKLHDAIDEIRHAATWARRLLEANPKAQIGVIVAPDLTRSRNTVERIFSQILDPGGGPAKHDRAFHLSVGPALAEYPVVHAALLLLEFTLGAMPLSRVGMLLRSPFLGGAEEERSSRALLDAQLRRRSIWSLSISVLRERAESCPLLQSLLQRVENRVGGLPRERAPSEWARTIPDLLAAFGWPGERSLNSVEYQTIQAWRELLNGLASLDVAASPISLAQTIDWLRETAANTRFQIEDEGAPVQVMGMLEASGLHFDHLCVLGLHDEALPSPASPNPFIPVSLQRRHNLPHSSSTLELEFATKLMHRLLVSARDVVLTYPSMEGDRALSPSPLASGATWTDASHDHRTDPWVARMRAGAAFEHLSDEIAPEFVQGSSTGGASLFKDMAACPFRAFAKHRLGARELEDPDLGLSYGDRGTTVHKALELIWCELGSHAALMNASSEALTDLIQKGADAAVAKLGPGIGRDIEKRRLQKLLGLWLEIEKSRAEFTVLGIEADRMATVSGVQVKIRADRVDSIADGREIILDYKTGLLKSQGWDGERPDQPQLPLYCVTNERPVAGAAFAMIRTGELGFHGLCEAGAGLPKMKSYSKSPLSFRAQIEEWRRVLDRLAANFRIGHAEVDPKPDACDHCGLRALCRIRELEATVDHGCG